MMYAVLLLTTLLSSVAAFTTRSVMRMNAEGMSASLPFLKKPKGLDGMVVGGLPHHSLGIRLYRVVLNSILWDSVSTMMPSG